ncbi:MAG: glycosyltransferase [Acidobacteria bacterium]|nr:glycosyltransferase [Acidobacteriota bacterium]
MRIAVVVATLGRPVEAGELAMDLAAQTRPPDAVVFCVMEGADAPAGLDGICMRTIACARKGSCAQRNIGIDAVAESADVIVFMDDDFVPAADYFEQLERFMAAHKEAAGVTGEVLADGVTGPGLSREDALTLLGIDRAAGNAGGVRRRRGLYGCNMAVRASAMGELRFDERLPLYGWLEDLDLSTRLSRRGTLYHASALRGVHRGVKRGRTSGVRFGYSQIANPLYLLVRGRAPVHYAFANICRNLAANLLRVSKPEPWVDRKGRLKGNGLAAWDLVRGRLKPERILEL